MNRTYKSYAKLNLGLRIINKREDGFHELSTIFQTINLHDLLRFEKAESLEVSADRSDIPQGPGNLVYKAADLLRKKTGYTGGVRITIEKHIPSGGGLGGGSSNAAVTLLALNRLWNLNIPHVELRALGGEIGSDVPFFFTGGTVHATGRGEIMSEIDDIDDLNILLASPPLSVSTPEAYKNVSRLLTYPVSPNNITAFLNGEKDLSSLTNDFEIFLFARYPLLEDVTKKIIELGAVKAGVTGSGACVFGLFNPNSNPSTLVKQMEACFPEVDFSASAPVTRDEYHRSLDELL